MLAKTTEPNIVEVTIVADNEALDVNIDALMRDNNLTESQVGTIIGESTEYVSTCYGKLLPRHIERLGKSLGVNEIDKYIAYPKGKAIEAEVIEAFPIVSEAVTTDPNTNIVKYVEENGDELETINPNQLLTDAKVTIAERIKRTSMLPTFQPDDIVFVRILKDKMKIVDGETYYLDCKNRPTMIRLVKFEGCDKLRLIAKNPQYGDIVIDRADIINIGVVVALFRMTFGDQYSEIEAVRRKKDEHLERMMDMLERKEEQQSKLIDYITKQ
jgi:SOS-response transcriptional repressor LexA